MVKFLALVVVGSWNYAHKLKNYNEAKMSNLSNRKHAAVEQKSEFL